MNDITRTLYEFTSHHGLHPWQDPQYERVSSYVQKETDSLYQLLDKDGQQLLKDMLDHLMELHCMESEQLFASTLCLCRELHGILST